jgi:hypothetical protein
LQAAIDSIHGFYGDIWGGGASNGMRAELTAAAEFATEVDTQEQREVDFPTLTVGGSSSDAPPVLQAVISWKTSSASRRGRGRTFMGPLSFGALEADGTLSDTFLQVLSGAAAGYVARSQAADDWFSGVYGLATSGGGPGAPHTIRQLTGFKIRDTLAVLRSRRD